MLMSKLFPELIWNFPDHKDTLYLTFDDGPTPVVTPWVLDVLKEYNTKATFFCLGKNVEKYPDIFERVKSEEHCVGNHGYSHLNGWITRNKVYYSDVERAGGYIDSRLFRPAFGKIKPSQVHFLKHRYKIVMWNVMSYDFKERISKEKYLEKLKKNIKGGSIIVFHDTDKAFNKLSYVLPKILEDPGFKQFKYKSLIY